MCLVMMNVWYHYWPIGLITWVSITACQMVVNISEAAKLRPDPKPQETAATIGFDRDAR
jgi:hypothetical protein